MPGRCELWVGIRADSDQLQGGLHWQEGNLHVAHVRGLTNGAVYDRLGNPIGNVVRKGDDGNSCTISIKRDEADYRDAWEALKTYINAVYSRFLVSENNNSERVERPYTFQILGEKSRDEVQWLDLVRGEKIAVVGLGGVGAWIADLLSKADVAEVHGWDADVIEEKNIIRMPGAVNPCWIGKPKAKWFEETYRQIHRQVFGYPKNVTDQNANEICMNTTFGFVAVDNEDGRKVACNAMAGAKIPFIDVGIALDRRDSEVTASIRLTINWPHRDAWQKAIPKVGKVGQEVYGKLELPDITAIAAGLALQSWRKMRGQMAQDKASECIVYRAETNTITVRTRG
ncbi:MAG: ThiF family adenylyltransferase [Candidatus Dadabacteria bacterium]|nr:ThiF family adenylyltransferase [Candidatus Dadabacteria bacterium]